MTLEESMKSAIETLGQLEALKAEVISLTETRDSLRGITSHAEEAHEKWLKTVEKTNALQSRVDAEVADKRLCAQEAAEKLIADAKTEAFAQQQEIVAGYSQKIAELEARSSRLTEGVNDSNAHLAELYDQIKAAEAKLDKANREIDHLKKTVSSL